MPGPLESTLGGHAVVCVGYNDSLNSWIVRNSWGPSWGDNGHFYLPYGYLVDQHLACDFWVVPAPAPAAPAPILFDPVKPIVFDPVKPIVFDPIPFPSFGSVPYRLADYGNDLAKNKALLERAFEENGITEERSATMLAMAMLETNTLSTDYRDSSKDDRTDGAANVSMFNTNIDMIRYLGFRDDAESLNRQENVGRMVHIIDTAFGAWGIERTLNFVRGGRTAFVDGISYGAQDYRNVISTITNAILSDPALRTDSRRVEIYLEHV